MTLDSVIHAHRLDLLSMSLPFLEACLAGEREQAASLLGFSVPEEWLEERWLMELRLGQLRENPALQPWLLRAIILRDPRGMIGYIGFHSAPGPEYLQERAPGGAEIGYTLFPAFRRLGYTTEAVAALMAWAAAEHGVPRFVLSISPENAPSLRIAARFGFRKVGMQIDEQDGPEDVYLREVAPPV